MLEQAVQAPAEAQFIELRDGRYTAGAPDGFSIYSRQKRPTRSAVRSRRIILWAGRIRERAPTG